MGAINEAFYISHGSPILAIDEPQQSEPARQFLKSWREKVFTQRPKAILLVSGHWQTNEPTVSGVDVWEALYDYHGNFPESMRQLKYPAPGAPDVATKVNQLLVSAGFNSVLEDKKRGLDHGSWIPLLLMYPDADIPVCLLSIQTHKNGEHHYNVGKALASLKEEGVLIVASGTTVHNLSTIHSDGTVSPWAIEFDEWLEKTLLDGRHEDVNNYEEKAPHAKMAHPRPNHFYPLHIALGAAGEDAKAEVIHRSWDYGTVSYTSYKFTTVSS
ncbi:hypothetical protein Droror1_Dr00025034 [Drosera rotundifolia]